MEVRMPRDVANIEQLRLPRRVELDQLVARAALHAMRGGENEIARDRGAGAERAVRAGDHYRVAALHERDRRVAGYGKRRGGGEGEDDDEGRAHGAMSLVRLILSTRGLSLLTPS